MCVRDYKCLEKRPEDMQQTINSVVAFVVRFKVGKAFTFQFPYMQVIHFYFNHKVLCKN